MRRWLAALLVAAALAWLGLGEAHAANCSSVADNCTKPQSYQLCLQAVDARNVQNPLNTNRCADYKSNKMWMVQTCYIAYGNCGPTGTGWSEVSNLRYYYATGCPAGEEFNAATGQCQTPCSSRPDMLNARVRGNGGSCEGGCGYAPVLGGGESYRVVTINGVSFTNASRLAPTGEMCSVSAENPQPTTGDEDQCIQDNTLTQCIKKDGSLCTQASSGKVFCWSPGENGIKTSGNEAASKVPEGKESKIPPVPPANGGDWEKIAEALVKISESKGGTTTTNNSTVNSYGSSYGGKGGGASGNGAAGQGNGGSGDGSGGDGDGDGDGDGPGGPGAGAGDLYTANGKTVAGLFADFRTRVGQSPLIGAVQDFFTVHGGGACPTFTVPSSAYWESMTYDAHCSGDFLAALRSIGWVLMAIAALSAAYWALS